VPSPATTSVTAGGTVAPSDDPAILPATGGSLGAPVVALVVLGVGILLLVVAQRFRITDDG
jgi:hypothetical protein